jgi:hypothetical protein
MSIEQKKNLNKKFEKRRNLKREIQFTKHNKE